MHGWGSRTPPGPLSVPLGAWGQGRGVKPNQVTIGKVPYNFDFTNSPSIWVTMAPEGHGAQDLPDPDLGSKKVTQPPLNQGHLSTFVF